MEDKFSPFARQSDSAANSVQICGRLCKTPVSYGMLREFEDGRPRFLRVTPVQIAARTRELRLRSTQPAFTLKGRRNTRSGKSAGRHRGYSRKVVVVTAPTAGPAH